MKNVKCKISKRMIRGLLFIVVCFFALAQRAEAAVYMLGGPQETVRVGQEIEVKIGIDTEGERINVVDAAIQLPPAFQFIGFDRGLSTVNLWIQDPAFDEQIRTATFIGGVPGGATGRIILLSMRLRPIEKGRVVLRPSGDSKAYLNYGLGTEAKVTMQELVLQVDEGEDGAESRLVWLIFGVVGMIFAGIFIRKLWHKKKA